MPLSGPSRGASEWTPWGLSLRLLKYLTDGLQIESSGMCQVVDPAWRKCGVIRRPMSDASRANGRTAENSSREVDIWKRRVAITQEADTGYTANVVCF